MSCQEKTDYRTCDHSGIVQKEAVQCGVEDEKWIRCFLEFCREEKIPL